VAESIGTPWRLESEQGGGFLRNQVAESAEYAEGLQMYHYGQLTFSAVVYDPQRQKMKKALCLENGQTSIFSSLP
jgi:hypothetical protein